MSRNKEHSENMIFLCDFDEQGDHAWYVLLTVWNNHNSLHTTLSRHAPVGLAASSERCEPHQYRMVTSRFLWNSVKATHMRMSNLASKIYLKLDGNRPYLRINILYTSETETTLNGNI